MERILNTIKGFFLFFVFKLGPLINKSMGFFIDFNIHFYKNLMFDRLEKKDSLPRQNNLKVCAEFDILNSGTSYG